MGIAAGSAGLDGGTTVGVGCSGAGGFSSVDTEMVAGCDI